MVFEDDDFRDSVTLSKNFENVECTLAGRERYVNATFMADLPSKMNEFEWTDFWSEPDHIKVNDITITDADGCTYKQDEHLLEQLGSTKKDFAKTACYHDFIEYCSKNYVIKEV